MCLKYSVYASLSQIFVVYATARNVSQNEVQIEALRVEDIAHRPITDFEIVVDNYTVGDSTQSALIDRRGTFGIW